MCSLALAAGLISQTLMPPAEPKPVPVQFIRQGPGQSVLVCLDGQDIRETYAGKLGFRNANGSSWYSVCAAVRKPVTIKQVFPVLPGSSVKAGGNVKLAGNIVAKHIKSATSNAQCAGLQLAVWEAVEDGGPKPDFGGGRFMAQASDEALRWAIEYYAAIETPGETLFLQAPGNNGQDQLGDNPP